MRELKRGKRWDEFTSESIRSQIQGALCPCAGGKQRTQIKRALFKEVTVFEEGSRSTRGKEYKFAKNVATQKTREVKKAEKAWDELDDEERERAGPKDTYVHAKVARAMENYLSDKDARMDLIQRCIVEGYDMHKRPPLKERGHIGDHNEDERSGDNGASTPENLHAYDVTEGSCWH
ncbi:hypothetical protein GOP47_0010203 [Adiantum capillus-veneris]|uniref:Uncharacterized protein n=1 Tax=Adiantum capillus-veneris TaxID=13818 RepID=A0A9D4ZHJ6_ADICA|nr:hypothetical protein GOP47_0010203 [Adiantum capillus-veneris]